MTPLAHDLRPPDHLPSPTAPAVAATGLAIVVVPSLVGTAADPAALARNGVILFAVLAALVAAAFALLAAQRWRQQQRLGVVVAEARQVWEFSWYCRPCDVVVFEGMAVPRSDWRRMVYRIARHRLQRPATARPVVAVSEAAAGMR